MQEVFGHLERVILSVRGDTSLSETDIMLALISKLCRLPPSSEEQAFGTCCEQGYPALSFASKCNHFSLVTR